MAPEGRLRCLALLFSMLFFLVVSGASAWATEDTEPQDGTSPGDRAGELLLTGHQALRAGNLEHALELLSRAVELLSGSDDRQLLLAARVNRAHVLARSGLLLEAMADFAAAIPQADVLAARAELLAPDLGIGVRLQLAQVLARHGSLVDAEAAAWDALEVAVRLGSWELAGPAVRTVLQLGALRDDSPAGLVALLDALDVLLLELDDYRLSPRPPPEPVIELVERSGQVLASRLEFAAARDLFEMVVLLDLARGAHWRLVSDLSDLSWVALQQGDLDAAHWALRWTEALVQGPRSAELLANWSSLQAEAGELVAAERSCRVALRQAGEEKSPARALALQARLARIVEMDPGRSAEALSLYRKSAEAYRKAGQESAALAEELRAADLLLDEGRLEDAAVFLAVVIGGIEAGSVLAADAQIRLHLANAQLSEQRGDLEVARKALAAAGSLLFDLGRVDALAGLGSRFGDLEIRAGNLEAAREAFENAQHFEAQLGLGAEAWQALQGLGVLAVAAGEDERAEEFFAAAAARIEWVAALPGEFSPAAAGPGELSETSPGPQWQDVYRSLVDLQLRDGRSEVALRTLYRAGEVRRLHGLRGQRSGRVLPEGRQEASRLLAQRERIDMLRSLLRDEAFRPSGDDAEKRRAELLDELAAMRGEEQQLVEQLQAVDPVLGAELSVSPLGASELRAKLEPGTVLLASYDLPDRVVLLAASSTALAQWQLPGTPAQVRSELAELWQQFGGRRVGLGLRRKLSPVLESWTERVILPGAELLSGADTILWVPDESLRSLPIVALPLGGRALVDRATVLGLHSLRGAEAARAALELRASGGLLLVPSVTERSAIAAPDLRTLASQLRDLRAGGSTAASFEVPGGPVGSKLPVVSATVSDRQRAALRVASVGVLLEATRPALERDLFIQKLREGLETNGSVLDSFKAAQRTARRVGRDPLGWASLTLFVD